MSDKHRFTITADWDPGAKSGRLKSADGSLDARFAGAASLGGPGGAANPEELLLAAVGSCFVITWEIFLKKLGVDIPAPSLGVSCEVEADPAGGYRVTAIDLAPRIPAALWASEQAKLEKTLQLAEKYCIVSKAVKGDGRRFSVTPVTT